MPVLSEHETWHRSRSPSPACLECSISALSRPRDGATYLDYDSDIGPRLAGPGLICASYSERLSKLRNSNPMTVVTDVTNHMST